jgi:hypothetical protein
MTRFAFMASTVLRGWPKMAQAAMAGSAGAAALKTTPLAGTSNTNITPTASGTETPKVQPVKGPAQSPAAQIKSTVAVPAITPKR